LVNTVWALVNLVVGYALFRAGRVSEGGYGTQLLCFAGAAVLSVLMSVQFAEKHAG
jgi:hypothetical protein